MITILLSIIQLIVIYFLIENKDIKSYLLLIVGIFILNLITFGYPMYYVRHMVIDVIFCLCAYVIKDDLKRIAIILICTASYFMNLYEHLSYYQTIFYEYRTPIQWCMLQMIYLILLYKTKWRTWWKTDSQN